jgi:deoxyribose-phosphate aldolase
MDTISAPNNPVSLAGKIELLILKQDIVFEELRVFCSNIQDHPLASVCVHGSQIARVRHALENSGIQVCGMVGFPLGLNDSDVKRYEVEAAVDNGAHEIAVAANASWIREGLWDHFVRELRDVAEASDERPVTVILETGLLTQTQIVDACHFILDSGAQFVQASTGFHTPLPGTDIIRWMRETVGDSFGVKAAGAIADSKIAMDYIEAGADRVVTTASLFFEQKEDFGKPPLPAL